MRKMWGAPKVSELDISLTATGCLTKEGTGGDGFVPSDPENFKSYDNKPCPNCS